LEAAAEEFQANGFEGTSMDRVAERASVSKRTIYNHFANKEALFEAITDEMIDQIIAISAIRYDAVRALEEQLMEIGRRKIDLMMCPSFMKFARVTIAEHLRTPDLAHDAYCRIHESKDGFRKWIAAGVADGRLVCDDPQIAAEQFESMLSGAAFWPRIFNRPEPSPVKLKKVLASAVALFLNYYAAPAERPKEWNARARARQAP
jgi:TetR/AcrR family transcriptional regulator of autoinduction and epiphytic fitness